MALSQEQLLEHSRAFENVLRLVPARYLASPDREAMELKYMKKNERLAAKMRRKNEYKEKKRQRMNPNQEGSVQLGAGVAENGEATSHVGGAGGAKQSLGAGIGKPPISRVELQAKLRSKIQEMRTARHADESTKGKKPKGKSEKGLKKKKKGKGEKKRRKRLPEQENKCPEGQKAEGRETTNVQKPPGKKRRVDDGGSELSKPVASVAEPSGKTATPFALGRVGLAEDGSFATSKSAKKKRTSKKEVKKELLVIAENQEQRKKKFQETGKGGEEVMQTAWNAALTRAGGRKVLDNPKLLKRSIKQDRRDRVKRAKNWKERVEKCEEDMAKRQEKRTANLKARAEARKQKLRSKRVRRKG